MRDNLNPAFPLRPYQEDALRNFIYYLDCYDKRIRPTQLLFHMATGSGKTLIMAASMLYLYQQGYRNFIFFVNSTTIIEKTRENFLNANSSKYLFAPDLKLNGQRVAINAVDNFQGADRQRINILFSTIQGLHSMLNKPRENALTYDDFEGRPTVLISDEAHHINVLTKSEGRWNKGETENVTTWEGTVNRIFQSDPDNLLLEFTATAELGHPAVAEKYNNKIVYSYPLRRFCEEGYSKEVDILQVDLGRMERALQAVIVSQYRKKVAERHGIRLKPVVLMKANYVNPPSTRGPNKVVSEEFRAAFHQKIRALRPDDLNALRESAKSNKDSVAQSAWDFFEKHGITLENLIRELQTDFSEEKALSVDSKTESEEHQILVNSLEDPDNEIRVVFAVERLNEGWDVLNLFDIVRLYNTRDARRGKPGKTTVAEAQLIGRGARYYPFQLNDNQPRFKRKFDDDLDNDLRVLEELHYHSAHNVRYISELRTALIDIGMKPKREPVQLRLNIKDDFKQGSFWKNGKLFTNERIRNDSADIFAIPKKLLPERYTHRLHTGYAEETVIFDEPDQPQVAQTHTKTFPLRDFGTSVLRSALARVKFYQFRNLRNYFPNLSSITEFITSDDYLGKIDVDVTGTSNQLQSLTPKMKMDICLSALPKLADAIRRGTPKFRGTVEFKPQAISASVKDKTLKRDPKSETSKGMREPQAAYHADLSKETWYIFDENYGTTEEKALVKFIQSQVQDLREKYEDIYLLRNEKFFRLYTFEDGRPFEPDFVFFLTEKETGELISYQLFIEPKGQHLIADDQWKEDFLNQIEKNAKIHYKLPKQKFAVVGMPFYNEQINKREFEQKFRQVLP
jgi:type III restriction enzyme